MRVSAVVIVACVLCCGCCSTVMGAAPTSPSLLTLRRSRGSSSKTKLQVSVVASSSSRGGDDRDEDNYKPVYGDDDDTTTTTSARQATANNNNQYSYASYQRGSQPQPLGVVQHQQNQQQYPYSQQHQQQQQQNQQQPQAHPVVNPLLKQAGTASIGALFALLIWRSLSAYELADQFASGSFRLLAVTPTIVILCANLAGFVVNLFKPINFKNHLKFILVINICREAVELAYNMLKVLLTSSDANPPREVYFGRFMMSTWWLFLCMTFSKSRWVSNVVLPKNYRTAV